jgi:alginate O-acetyltransferase complex protein AlgI
LIAGPIVRFADVEEDLRHLPSRLAWEQTARGIFFFCTGLAKKILIADRLAPFVNDYFSAPDGHGMIAAWIGVLGYTFQLYFDFSGYSDMAVGLAQLLGIHFPQNFDSPYKAVNISDFWRRWHISLSRWLRDYLFIPLGGSQGTHTRTLFNLALTMFLGGLWHGANWTFVLWGLYHGTLLAAYHGLKQTVAFRLPTYAARLITFGLVSLGWVLFRADSVHLARNIYFQLFGFEGLGHATILYRQVLVLIAAAAITQVLPNTWEIRLQASPKLAYVLAVVFLFCILYLGKTSPFLYFQF